MKKLLSLALALMLALSCVSVVARPAHAENASALPKVGDVTNGFEVKEIQPFALVGADLVLFEHQRTGAKLLWIANADTNRLFQLTFPTRPNNDMGLPHVFEHATLFGSDKYPSTSLFFNISYQTYNTYVNAYTTDACTSYPLASLSEKQLLNLADYYVDSCFHPLIMSDEGIFRTQAWHYDLNSLDGELTYEGVVYSEMQGAMTLERTALEYANDLTFPGAALSYSYGGLPENIPEMTWEDVKAYHDKYYHPSNCLAILYGQFDEYEAFLKLLDEAFAPYEKVEFTFEDAGYKPIEKAQVASFGYPMAEGTDVTNQTVIIYYILCPGMKGDVEQENLIDNVSSLLNQNGSVLSQSFKRAFPSGNLSCGREVAGPDDAIIFQATGMNRDDAEKFKALVDEALLDVANNGFPQDMVDSAMTSLNISAKLAPENGDPAEGVVYSFAYDYAVTGDPFAFVNQMASLSRIDEENQKGLLKEAVAKWLTNNELYTLTTTYPAPGEKEKVDAALKEELAKIKAGMSQEQLQAIVDETNAAPKEEDTSELMAKIKAITVENLPEEVKAYTVNDFTDDKGIRHIEAVAGVDGIGHVSLELDAAALPQEDIHWMRLYTRLLGKLDTDKHTKEELDVLIDRYMYDKVTGVDCVDLKDSIHPYLVGEWYALDDDLATGYDLMEELLFHTRFDDVQKLLEQVQAQKTSVRATINNNAYSVMLYRGLADKSPFYLYYSYLNFLEYYAFLENLEAMLGEKPQEVTKHFEELQSFFANSAGAVAAFAGNEKSIELNRPLADAFLAKLKHEDREPVAYDLPLPSQREALITDGNVQFNNVIATADDMGLEGFDAGLEVVASLVSDKILVPILRDQMGVYTPWNGVMDNGAMYLVSYRDPNLKDTFDVYASLADRIAQLEVDQDTLDGYIMSSYSSLAKPKGELTGAIAAIGDTLAGKKLDRNLEYMRQIKKVTPEAVKTSAELYRKAWENGVHSTAGSAAAINQNTDLFDSILNPFNAQDSSKVAFTDAAEGSEHYDAVRFVFEESLMTPKAQDAFGTDEPATAKELYGALYVLIGGAPGAVDEAFAFFDQNKLVPAGVKADTPLTNGLCDQIFVTFGAAVGIPLQADAPNEKTDLAMTRGELAEQIKLFCDMIQ